ncbi:MAG: hypothetical protein IKC01_01925 [Clostridia bacterium]|nr:hypothetical protein [Clostridia bacterium]
MADYSYNEIMKMQNDAIKRVNEMQKRAKSVVNELTEEEKPLQKTASPKKEDAVKRIKMPNDYLDELKSFAATSSYFEQNNKKDDVQPHHHPEQNTNHTKNTAENTVNSNDLFKNLLGGMELDSDKTLILSLILLLTEEKADEMLILSLLYMLT